MKAELGAHHDRLQDPGEWSPQSHPVSDWHSHMAEAQSAELWLLGFIFLEIQLMPRGRPPGEGEEGKGYIYLH